MRYSSVTFELTDAVMDDRAQPFGPKKSAYTFGNVESISISEAPAPDGGTEYTIKVKCPRR